MARLARVVIPGIPHHVTQRGTRRQEVFFCEADRFAYLDLLKESVEQFGVVVWAWCLMPNHVHFVVVPEGVDSLALCFRKVHTQYTRMINFREKWRGALWQGRFASCPMDEAHTYHAVRYVERNPVRARMVRRPWRYAWSSAAYHVGEGSSDALIDDQGPTAHLTDDWRDTLLDRDQETMVDTLREETMAGRPAGDEGFLLYAEKRTGRYLRRGEPGRPTNQL